ncbi:restriction endonuclease subunit S [Cypionkella sinensis]|uniref:Restriction endonuclease subunit S n=1 Tax=Cypionkella sinensis TaxID=1756043 RepID=A0ABV7J3X6_9RHOB
MTGMPTGWALAPINTFARSRSGNSKLIKGQQAQEPAAGLFPAFSASGQDVWVAHPEHEGNAIIISAVGARCGKTFRATGQWSAVANTHIVWPEEIAVDTDWLQLLLNDENFWEKGGSAQPFVKVNATFEREIPLPPLPEQRRIARKLDTLSARSTTARSHLTAIEKLAERYRTAVLEAAFRTAWDAGCNTTIAGCLEHAETGLVRSKAEQTADEGYPYIRMNHYDLAGRWNDRDLTYVAATSSEFERYQLRAHDLLFNTRNSAELVGKVAIWPEGKDGYLFNNNLLRMRFSEDVVPAFAFWQMSSPPFRRYIEGFISATTSVAAIYQRSLMAAPFWVPDTDEQHEIVRRIETAFAKIDRLAAEAAKALKLVGHLDQRILAKAFAGDLVPQDPTDEPAETLLARIREERLSAVKGKRVRKPSA